MSPEQLAAIRARIAAATPGPWAVETPSNLAGILSYEDSVVADVTAPPVAGVDTGPGGWIIANIAGEVFAQSAEVDDAFANADLIAHAPSDLAALCDALATVSAEREILLARLRDIRVAHAAWRGAVCAYVDLPPWRREETAAPYFPDELSRLIESLVPPPDMHEPAAPRRLTGPLGGVEL